MIFKNVYPMGIPFLFLALSSLMVGCPHPQKKTEQPEKRLMSSHLQKMLKDFQKKITRGKYRVAIGNFSYKDSKVPSEFARYLTNDLSLAMSRCNFLEEFPRDKLEAIIKEMKLSQRPIIDEETAAELGKIKGLEGIMVGNYWPDGKQIKIYLRLIQVETGKNLYTNVGYVPQDLVPQSIQLAPTNFKRTEKILKAFSLSNLASRRGLKVIPKSYKTRNFSLNQKAPLKIKVWTDRGNSAIYRLGEKMTIYFRSNKTCYLRLYHISAKGEIQLIFPLPGMTQGNVIQANQTYMIPRREDNFAFKMTRPLGTEIIKAIVSTAPFKNSIQSFQNLGNVNSQNLSSIFKRTYRTRGLKVQWNGNGNKPAPPKKVEYITEDTCIYSIVE